MRFTLAALGALLPLLVVLFASSAVQPVEAASFGLAVATDGSKAAKHLAKGRVKWYWHWQDPAVPQMPSHIEYVPCFWGPRYASKWHAQERKWKRAPSRILAFNEPDVPSQSNMNPYYAAELWMQELRPWQKRGAKVSTPQIVFDVDWMDKFLKKLKQLGGKPDFLAIHWYGTPNNAGYGRFTSWVTRCRKRYGMKIWVTEWGVTSKGTTSQGQVNSFMQRTTDWLQSKDYVKRIVWFGCFTINNPPDAFASRRNALFNADFSLRSIARFYTTGQRMGRRDLISGSPSLEHRAVISAGAKRHSNLAVRLAARDADEESFVDVDGDFVDNPEDDVEDDCDAICLARERSLAAADAAADALEDPDVVLESDDDSDSEELR